MRILSPDLLHLGAERERLPEARVDLIHVDVMDGVLCPQLTEDLGSSRRFQASYVDAHLMISDPLPKIDA